MNRLSKMLLFVLLIALCLPAWTAGAQTLSTEQKFQELKEKGIFTGVADGSSRLGDPMTREQFAAVLFRLWGLEESNPTRPTFADVLRTRWSYTNIEGVSKAGLMQGVGNGKFAPLSEVTVEQLAAVFVRAYGYTGPGNSPVTGKSSLWARGSVSIALDHDFIPVMSDYTAKATRALLVEAAYAADLATKKLDVNSVQPLTNSTIQVKLNTAVNTAEVSHFKLQNEQGGSISILRTDISSDGKTVTVYTGTQSPNVIHTLFIDGEGWRYTALADYSDDDDNNSGDSTRPRITSVTNTNDRLLKITFSESVSRSSATNPDNYEVTRGDLDLKSFELSDDRRTVLITTSAQEDGYSYRLTVHGVRDLSGNVMTSRSDITFVGKDDDNTKPTVKSVTNNGNNTIKVVFSEEVNSGDAKDTDNYRANNWLQVTKATLASDGRTVTLYTSEQKNGQGYTLTIRDIRDLAGNRMDSKSFDIKGFNDNTKPKVVSVNVLENSTVRVQFSEKVNESQATNKSNYSVDNGLSILSVYMEDSDDSVILTTSKQKDGVLYELTVKGISDYAGNVMDKQSDLWFGGIVDDTKPTVTNIQADVSKVVLTFSERLNSSTATRSANYKFDGGLSPKSVKYDDAKRTVTIETAAQTPGKVYTLTINDVKDLGGLSIADDTRLQFVGVDSNSSASISLQSITVVDQNTVQVAFSRALYDSDVSSLKLAVVKDNGAALSNDDWGTFVSRKAGTDNVVLVQFSAGKNGNPSLFKAGHVYVGQVTGINGLKTDDGANLKPFAGTDKTNAQPYATKAAAVNAQAVKVTFSEPVRNVSKDGFRILRDDGSEVGISGVSVSASSIVSEVTLYLDDSLRSGRTYRVQFRDSVTDAAGWNVIKTKDGSEPYQVVFVGSSSDNAAPRIEKVTSSDRYTFEIKFSEPVRIQDTKGFSLYNESDKEEINISKDGYAYYVQSADRTTLTVYLNSNKNQQLRSGKRYSLEFDYRYGLITDDQGAPLNGATDTVKTTFTSTGAENASPAISKVEARGSQIWITFSEPIQGYSGQTNLFDVEISGKDVTPTSGSIQGQTIVLSVPSMTSGAIGRIEVNEAGAKALRDYNQIAPKVFDIVTFGVQ